MSNRQEFIKVIGKLLIGLTIASVSEAVILRDGVTRLLASKSDFFPLAFVLGVVSFVLFAFAVGWLLDRTQSRLRNIFQKQENQQ